MRDECVPAIQTDAHVVLMERLHDFSDQMLIVVERLLQGHDIQITPAERALVERGHSAPH